jgi:hypothetical protein
MLLRTLLLTVTFVPVLLFGQQPLAQPGLRLKTRTIATDSDTPQFQLALPAQGRVHRMIQFNTAPTSDTVTALTAQGISVVGAVPVNGLLVTLDADLLQIAFPGQPLADISSALNDTLVGLGVRFVAAVDPSDKISPIISLIQASGALAAGSLPFNGNFLVEFHNDVTADEIRSLILNQGVMLIEHPDLSSNHLLVHFSNSDQMAAALVALTGDDRVAYIFPASDDLANGISSRAYSAPATVGGPIAQTIPTNGYGWDGPGENATTLAYYFSQLTAKMPATQQQSEIFRAMAEWSKVIKLTWTPGTSATATRTVNILFASRAHGDGFPFDGPGGVLAHTFYPAPPNPEPIAGDMHLDNDENWNAGVNTDLFSVSLHELGHALGLGHSDNPADVMYPYYKIVTTLAAGDKAAILTMYAAQDGTPSTPVNNGSGSTGVSAPVAPLTLAVQTPQAPGTASTIALSGSVSGGIGTVTVSWSANGASGAAVVNGANWSVSNVPLATGANTITVTASNNSKTASQTVTVTRQATGGAPPAVPPTAPPAGKDTIAPTLTIASPASTTVTTTLATYSISGTASDNVAVASVTWVTSTGGSGTAAGTSNWTAQIAVLKGFNQVTIRATDTSGNYSWRSILITRQ